MHRSALAAVWTFAFLAVLLLIGIHAQQTVFRSSVDSVLLDVLPTERGRIVTDLRPSEVEVRDNGVLQSVTSLSNEASSLGVFLLLDTSGSLTLWDLEHLHRGADSLASLLRPSDQLNLITFSQTVRLHGVRTASTLDAAFSGLEPAGTTALNDALAAGFRLADRGTNVRPVVIALSDGRDTASWLTAKDVNDAARMSWASFFGVTPTVMPAPLLEDLAQLTGGNVVKLTDDMTTLSAVFRQILERLRQRYLVSFTPTSSTAGWHELDVRVKRSSITVLARRGYMRK
ncbi:MAG TPA: VWA domain-containing protein [Vicinamibacterales bacterium]|nr:VWA domain-containing protein [Vicinamibacterales bacterium]